MAELWIALGVLTVLLLACFALVWVVFRDSQTLRGRIAAILTDAEIPLNESVEKKLNSVLSTVRSLELEWEEVRARVKSTTGLVHQLSSRVNGTAKGGPKSKAVLEENNGSDIPSDRIEWEKQLREAGKI